MKLNRKHHSIILSELHREYVIEGEMNYEKFKELMQRYKSSVSKMITSFERWKRINKISHFLTWDDLDKVINFIHADLYPELSGYEWELIVHYATIHFLAILEIGKINYFYISGDMIFFDKNKDIPSNSIPKKNYLISMYK